MPVTRAYVLSAAGTSRTSGASGSTVSRDMPASRAADDATDAAADRSGAPRPTISTAPSTETTSVGSTSQAGAGPDAAPIPVIRQTLPAHAVAMLTASVATARSPGTDQRTRQPSPVRSKSTSDSRPRLDHHMSRVDCGTVRSRAVSKRSRSPAAMDESSTASASSALDGPDGEQAASGAASATARAPSSARPRADRPLIAAPSRCRGLR